MAPERWEQINQLLNAALELESEERAAFLAHACAADAALRREVESLLAFNEQSEHFLDSPPGELAAELLTQRQPQLAAGRQIGHYQILSLLGRGGMGEVYLAQDVRLHRKTALKLLPAQSTRDPERVRRFRREAQAASALSHPNIITLYEIGAVDETHFLVTEYVEGETLRQRIERDKLPLAVALDSAAQRPAHWRRRMLPGSCIATSSRPMSCCGLTALSKYSTSVWPS
jgi:eukaryotic-like serine/threonine-protein kinase